MVVKILTSIGLVIVIIISMLIAIIIISFFIGMYIIIRKSLIKIEKYEEPDYRSGTF